MERSDWNRFIHRYGFSFYYECGSKYFLSMADNRGLFRQRSMESKTKSNLWRVCCLGITINDNCNGFENTRRRCFYSNGDTYGSEHDHIYHYDHESHKYEKTNAKFKI